MKSKLKIMFRQCYRKMIEKLPTKVVLNIENFRGYHKFVNFKNPKYFGEKIQWLKLNGNLEQYRDYADKYKVRRYVESKVGKKYLIKLIGVYNSPEEIDYDSLPNKFVLKLNTGSGYNIIVKNKAEFDKEQANRVFNKWLKEDYYKMKKEPQYKNINKKILVEQYVSDVDDSLVDYKFFCFNGQPKFLKVDYGRYSDHRVNFYDLSWNQINLREGNFKNTNNKIKKPNNFEEMVETAKKLSEQFQFVRVDLYNVNGKIYFGELTFTPAAGINPFFPLSKDVEIASYIDLKK